MARQKRWSAIHYNAVAKEIRELFPTSQFTDRQMYQNEWQLEQAQRSILTTLALSFAVRFNDDWLESEEGIAFDPVSFLNKCSPDADLYPLGELWEGSKRG